MMGTKDRVFAMPPSVTLEDLVPAARFSRHLERTLDLSFVRKLVRDRYALSGRPSIDPVVFFKFQLVLFFEGLRSERQLLRIVADCGWPESETAPQTKGMGTSPVPGVALLG